jgi:methionyl-tRNA formyltransferase
MMRRLSYLFAGDRQLAVDALDMLLARSDPPVVLCVSDGSGASHRGDLIRRFTEAGGTWIISSSDLRDEGVRQELLEAELDFALSVHFPHIIDQSLLHVPRRGWLNLHPAYLPWNRGWHTPSWAILEGTPTGATIHRMSAAVDAGAILARREVAVSPDDTAHTLYGRLLSEELTLLDESWDTIRSGNWPRIPNPPEQGSFHRKAELLSDEMQRIDLDRSYEAGVLINRLRALTTNSWQEAPYFEANGNRYRVRIEIHPEAGR